MKKKNRTNNNRIKRKNQNSRIRAKKANKQNVKSLTKKRMEGIIIKDEIIPFAKSLWPNQAQP